MEKTIIKTVLGSKMELRFSLKLCKKTRRIQVGSF